jgi:hypothetical protein
MDSAVARVWQMIDLLRVILPYVEEDTLLNFEAVNKLCREAILEFYR